MRARSRVNMVACVAPAINFPAVHRSRRVACLLFLSSPRPIVRPRPADLVPDKKTQIHRPSDHLSQCPACPTDAVEIYGVHWWEIHRTKGVDSRKGQVCGISICGPRRQFLHPPTAPQQPSPAYPTQRRVRETGFAENWSLARYQLRHCSRGASSEFFPSGGTYIGHSGAAIARPPDRPHHTPDPHPASIRPRSLSYAIVHILTRAPA